MYWESRIDLRNKPLWTWSIYVLWLLLSRTCTTWFIWNLLWNHNKSSWDTLEHVFDSTKVFDAASRFCKLLKAGYSWSSSAVKLNLCFFGRAELFPKLASVQLFTSHANLCAIATSCKHMSRRLTLPRCQTVRITCQYLYHSNKLQTYVKKAYSSQASICAYHMPISLSYHSNKLLTYVKKADHSQVSNLAYYMSISAS